MVPGRAAQWQHNRAGTTTSVRQRPGTVSLPPGPATPPSRSRHDRQLNQLDRPRLEPSDRLQQGLPRLARPPRTPPPPRVPGWLCLVTGPKIFLAAVALAAVPLTVAHQGVIAAAHTLTGEPSALTRAQHQITLERQRVAYWRAQARPTSTRVSIEQAARVSCALINDPRWAAGSRALHIPYQGCNLRLLLTLPECEGGWTPAQPNHSGSGAIGPWQIMAGNTWPGTPGDQALGPNGITTIAGGAASAAEIMGRRGSQPWTESRPCWSKAAHQ